MTAHDPPELTPEGQTLTLRWVLALANVFGIADRSGQLVTRRMVSERLTELGGHVGGVRQQLAEPAGTPLPPDTSVRRRQLSWLQSRAETNLAAWATRPDWI